MEPTGTVTFLFTDIEGSTALWARHPEGMPSALEAHDRIVRTAIERHDGRVFSVGGDRFGAVFARGDAAVAAAIEAQRDLTGMAWPDGIVLRSRMALHTGEAVERDGNYFGVAVNQAARVRDAANGAQILLTATPADVIAPHLPPESRLADLGEHELRDIVATVRLYRLEDPSFPVDRRPPRTGGSRTGNLPVARDPLVGREEELERLVADVRAGGLVTVTGAGGVGKTRLALELGQRSRDRWPDGVWLAALDDVNRPAALADTLLGLFGIESRAEGDRVAALVEALRHRRALLILDNCEHLVDAAAEVAEAIVSSCPRVGVVATSREHLDIAGEHVRRLRPLDTSDGGPAVRLFLERASAAGAEIAQQADTLIGEICRRVDGIPLAIELAAARARTLQPNEILDRLDDMFRLLAGGRRRSVDRHRTLWATIDWSHDLLGDGERAVLARLSVFAGSFSLAAARAVTAPEGVDESAFVDLLDQLVARSLVVPVAEGGESRFRLLEPVRQFAAEQLAKRGESDGAREAHARYFLDLMVSLGERWRSGDDQGAWPAAARDSANLRPAFEWLVEHRLPDDAQRFVVAAFGPIVLHFEHTPYDWAQPALLIDLDHVGPWTTSACAVAAWGAMVRGDTEGAARWIRRGAAALEVGSLDEGLLVPAALHNVVFGGELAVEREFIERGIESARASGDLARAVFVLSYTGHGEEALEAAEELGNRVLLFLARDAVWPSDEQARWDLLEGSWEIAQQSHSFIARNMTAHKFGAYHVRRGDPLDGLLLLRTAARDWLFRGDTRVWDVLYSVAAGFTRLGDLRTAALLLQAIGDRHVGTVVSQHEQEILEPATTALEELRKAREVPLDAGAAVDLAGRRIEEIAEAAPAVTADATLTARQLEIADFVGRGLSNKEIAKQLGISRYTAETHVRNILERLGAVSRAQIATWVAERQAAATDQVRRAHT